MKHLGKTRLGELIRTAWLLYHFHLIYQQRGSNQQPYDHELSSLPTRPQLSFYKSPLSEGYNKYYQKMNIFSTKLSYWSFYRTPNQVIQEWWSTSFTKSVCKQAVHTLSLSVLVCACLCVWVGGWLCGWVYLVVCVYLSYTLFLPLVLFKISFCVSLNFLLVTHVISNTKLLLCNFVL